MVIGFTGARGLIGSYLFRHIASRRADSVRVLLRNVRKGEDFGAAEIVFGDLLSPVTCQDFVDGLNVIYYLAHCNTPVSADHHRPNDVLMNAIPFLNLLEAVHARKTKPHIVYFSSGGAIYGRKVDRLPIRETDPCAPSSFYGIQKLAAEHYLRAAAEKGELTCVVLCVGNAYGTLLQPERMRGLIGVAIRNVLHNAPMRVFGNPANVRDYIHLEDICIIAEKAADRKAPFTILNIGSGLGHSVEEVLNTIPVQIERVPGPPCGEWLTDWVVLDVTRAREFYGWSPVVDLAAGIRGMFDDPSRYSSFRTMASGRPG